MLRCALAIEDRPGGFGKGSTASLTAKSLLPVAGFAEFFKVLLLTALKLSIVWTGFIWTKISRFGKLLHLSPSDWYAWSLHHFLSTLKRETIQHWQLKKITPRNERLHTPKLAHGQGS